MLHNRSFFLNLSDLILFARSPTSVQGHSLALEEADHPSPEKAKVTRSREMRQGRKESKYMRWDFYHCHNVTFVQSALLKVQYGGIYTLSFKPIILAMTVGLSKSWLIT